MTARSTPPEQLSFSLSRADATRLQEQLARAEAHILDLQCERDDLKTKVSRLHAELTACHKANRQASSEAYRKIDQLQHTVDVLFKTLKIETRTRHTLPTPDRAALVGELTTLVALVHPDKHCGAPLAEELTKAVLTLRERVQEGRL